jgi:hypothetical protein
VESVCCLDEALAQKAKFGRVAWLFGTVMAYFMLVVPGMIVHVFCVYNGCNSEPRRTQDCDQRRLDLTAGDS